MDMFLDLWNRNVHFLFQVVSARSLVVAEALGVLADSIVDLDQVTLYILLNICISFFILPSSSTTPYLLLQPQTPTTTTRHYYNYYTQTRSQTNIVAALPATYREAEAPPCS
ncbi:hypothetical protein BDQ17DRAFT_348766 [Cyathus striatus]|nr:hypothetical protein BDQ17DRAFT_348766 [Cyathus striatus]